MAEAAISCVKCGARWVVRGADWEVAVEVEMWRQEHARAEHDGERVSAWKIEPGSN
jgi:hypothetical protein